MGLYILGMESEHELAYEEKPQGSSLAYFLGVAMKEADGLMKEQSARSDLGRAPAKHMLKKQTGTPGGWTRQGPNA